MRKSIVSIFSFLFFVQLVNGQENVLENTNVKELARMEQEFTENEAANRVQVEKYAKEHNLLINHYLPSGKIISMVAIEHGKPVYKQTENARASATISTNKLYPSATVVSKYNLAGRGYNVGEWDGGTVRVTHREFEGRAVQSDNGSTPVSEHATHVGGTLVAAGISTSAKGMAYQAKLLAHDWDNDDAEMTVKAAQGLLVSNHSYGTPCGWERNESTGQWEWLGTDQISTMYDYKFGFYDNRARDWDRISFNAPYYLIVKSAGNSRNEGPGNNPNRPNNGPYDCIPTYSVAKNILTVGAVNGLANGYVNPNGVVISDFSSYGPADDGRIKPDVVGDGVNVSSCGIASDNQIVSLSGTSMSGPSVAGSCLLLQEMYSNSHFKKKMRSSTLKGLVIHTADECWSYAGPDYRFGWGLMNTRKAADVIIKDSISSILKEDVLANQQVSEFVVTANGTDPLVATLCWTDYQGTPGPPALNSRLKMLVNDLDLRVINESNQAITLPWRLNPDSVTSPARKNDNSVDNVEKVELPGATGGQTYKIRISHKGNLFAGNGQTPQQHYSLIVTGVVVGDTAATCIPLQYMNAKTGILDDGSGASKSYANNADCGWVLNPEDSGSIVRVIFRNFNVQPSDTLYVYSGTSSAGPLIGKFSGTALPDTIFSTTSQMYLNFKSDASGNASGWEISYSSMPKPKFDFTPDSKTICAGSTVTFSVQALNGPTTDWIYNWNIPGANNMNPSTANPTVGYTDVGLYPVSLSVTNKAGTTLVTKSDLINVKPVLTNNQGPYFQGFELSSFPVDPNPDLNWTSTPDANPWVRNTLSPFEGVAALRIRNATGKKDIRELVSPPFNLSNPPAANWFLTFRVAYARISTAAAADQLRVLVSTNCGKSWIELYKRSHTTTPKLSTIGDLSTDIVPGTFIPEPFQYRKDSISLASLTSTQNVLIKFEMTSEKGNFLYLDNVNLSFPVANESLLNSTRLDLMVFPNPGGDDASLMVRNPGNGTLQLELSDLTGKVVSSSEITKYDNQGTSSVSTREAFGKIPAGIYFIRAKSGAGARTIRWIKN